MGKIKFAALNMTSKFGVEFICSRIKLSRYYKIKIFTAFILLFIISFQNSKAQFVKHSYRLNNTFSASEPDCGPDLIPSKSLGNCNADSVPGSFLMDTLPFCLTGRKVYHTNLYWGLKYPNSSGYLTTTYTINLYVKNTKWSPKDWLRIIDFDSASNSDVGFYFEKESLINNYCLCFWPISIIGTCPNFVDSTYYLLTFTRDGATGVIDIYVNNKLFGSFKDSTNLYVAKASQPIYIYRDDQTFPCESAEANIAYLSFSNQYSSQAEVTSVYNNICIDTLQHSADFNVSIPISCDTNKNVTVTYTGNIIAPGTNYTFDWNWDGGKVLSGSGMGPYVVNWNTPGNKQIELSIPGGTCATPVAISKTISVENISLTIATIPASCSGRNGSIIATAIGGARPYQYSLDGLNFQSSDTFNVLPGRYSITVKDINNCTAGTSVELQMIEDLTVQTRSDTSVCQGQPVKLFTNSNGTDFLWYPSATLNNNVIKDPVATPLSTIDYIVSATKGNCAKYDTVRIVVTPPLLASVVTRSDDCSSNFSGTITVNVSGGASPYMYSLDGSNFHDKNVFTVAAAGEHTISVKDANDCIASVSATIVPANVLTLQLPPDTSVCRGQVVPLTTTSNATNYSWQPSAGLNDPRLKSPVANPVITTDYIVTATYGSCTKKDTVRVTIIPSITVITSTDTLAVANSPVQLNAYSPQLTGASGISYLWTPSTGLNNPNIANPVAILKANQIYSVEITSLQGCKGSSTIKVEILEKPDIYVPTAFSPNNDGTNDILKPICVGVQSLKYFKVFNRWGKLIYATSTINQGWNGKLQGINQPTGTYVWFIAGITIHGQAISKKGISLLIR